MSTTQISGTYLPEELPGSVVSMHVPGYTGTVTRIAGDSGGADARSVAASTHSITGAAESAGAFVVSELLLDLTPPPPADHDGTGRSAAAPASLLVRKLDGHEYAMLETAEDGTTTWSLPEQRDAETLAFRLPPAITTAPAGDGGRGPITGAMRRVVRVVGWAAAPLLEAGALTAARTWESRKRAYGIRQVTPGGQFVAPDWRTLGGGPLLLLVHGTFSTPAAGFVGWIGTAAFAALLQRYGNRCLALAHPSLSASPDENVEWLVSQLPATLPGPVDIVCHSRGGLVARALAAHQRLAVRRVCQVGAPNLGTPLASKEHMIEFLDGHTAFVTKLPDGVATIIVEGTLSLLKLVAMGGHGLPGLASMLPQGGYLGGLAQRNLRSAQWYTIGANYNPGAAAGAGMFKRLADKVVDKVFSTANDLVVPTDGCHSPGPQPSESLQLDGGVVHHTNYFHDARVHDKLAQWLV